MLRNIIKTVLLLDLVCSLLFTIIGFISKNFSVATFFYILTLAPFTVFLGPTILLTIIYAFLFKKNPAQSAKRKRLISFISLTAFAIFIWVLIEIFDWQNDIRLWSIALVIERITHSEMRLGAIIFIPLCILTSYLFDRFADRKP